ncbi:redoxin domain-containing protein [Flavobacterium sp. NST-5]|uniref:Redoxin domain-containing protein n=1 Tax=Flavobacterium ichthyis TaxID=2698827 RepID=A0ABW9ZAX2_9FLAO|nr:TlpA disulfide reductase family protein [Flavobacterium ichthyis]NBL65714.1 redoxin domain-containing protein [Flavobacterium ichthyis]
MKKLLFAVVGSTLLFSCNKNDGGYTIEGNATGFTNGQTVVLEKQDTIQMKLVPVDTATIENGKFTITGDIKEPELYFLQVDKAPSKLPFILENGTITVTLNKDSIQNTKISGTYNNDELASFNKETKILEEKIAKYQADNGPAMQEARGKNDTVTINKLMKGYTDLSKEMLDSNIKYAETHPKSFLSVLILERSFYSPEVDFARVEKTFNSLSSDLKNTTSGKKISQKLKSYNAVQVGKKAPDFSAKNPDGKTISLKESMGKVTIIDFWASWCAPCRQENPHVVALYNEFHSKGLNIIGVSLDQEGKADAWKKAIADDQLTWPQVSNLKFWNEPIAKKYNVSSIPATFILDENGVIVAKDLRGEELKAKVKELLGA